MEFFRSVFDRIESMMERKVLKNLYQSKRLSAAQIADILKLNQKTVRYWCSFLNIEPEKLGKVSIIKLRGKGTYRKKNQLGVLQIACHNTKLKLIMDSFLKTLTTQYPAAIAQLVEHVHGRNFRLPTAMETS